MSSLGCGSDADSALANAKIGFQRVFGLTVVDDDDDLKPGTCKYVKDLRDGCLCR
jgi:hypothetical protein